MVFNQSEKMFAKAKNKSKVWPITSESHNNNQQDLTNIAGSVLNDCFTPIDDDNFHKGPTLTISDKGVLETQFDNSINLSVNQNSINQISTQKVNDFTSIDIAVTKTKASYHLCRLKSHFQHLSYSDGIPITQSNHKKNMRMRELSDVTRSKILAKADILFVAGGITTLTGFMVAFMGVYPRNQAEIRLYLEIFGCLMVSTGVIMILFGMRLRMLSVHHTLVEARSGHKHGFSANQSINQTNTRPRSMPIMNQRFDSANENETTIECTMNHYRPMSRKDYEILLGPFQATVSEGLSAVLTVSTLIAVRRNMSSHLRLHHITEVMIVLLHLSVFI